jgi:amino acid adenylation domain-containing protein/non-ribosomal peptide synthase protein (TIGR01720 family)
MKKQAFQNRLVDSIRRFKTNTAIEYGDRLLTYADLNERSDRIDNWIRKKGIERETFIGILARDRIEYISSIIGVLKAGCSFVPLDPANPDDRLIRMIDVLGLSVIFIDGGYKEFPQNDTIKERHIEFVVLEDLFSNEDNNDFSDRSYLQYSPEDKIYVYFTSGTTHLPKAIVGKSKSLLHYCEWEIETFKIDETLRISQFATTSDAFLKEIFVTFLSGGTLCIPENFKEILHAEALIEWIEKNKINMIHCVPHVFRILSSNKLHGNNFPCLRYLVLSGEKIYPYDFKNWYDKIGERVQLVNLYGTTETTILNTCYFIKKSDVNKERIPVGKPIKGNRVIILDENMNICPKSVPGEIYIRTPFRTSGYYNDDKLNQEKFIKNPFNDNPEDLIFKTGDLGRWLPDGNIEFLGRIDRQVKIRGHRIELEEIESILIKHHMVKEAVVVKKELLNKGELLLAYVSENKGNGKRDRWSLTSLKKYLAENLPDYMVPTQIIKIKEIPRKPNRKIDYERLPDPSKDEEKEYILPANEIEWKLVELWSETLKLERVGVTDNFFERGGSSLNVMSLTYKIHREFDIRIPLGEIFNNPTIRQQAEIIGVSKEEKHTLIHLTEEKEYYELSSAQQRFYVLQQMEPGNLAYNIYNVVAMEGRLEKKKLEEVFIKLIERHESLRTSFLLVDEKPVQRVYPNVDFKIEYFKVEADEYSGNPERLFSSNEKIIQDFIQPFDLSRAPILRVGLINEEEEKHIFMAVTHHIISDGISHTVLLQDFMNFYRGEELPPLKFQYKDFLEWMNSEKQKDMIIQQKKYWLKQFENDIPVLSMLNDYARPEVQSFEGRNVKFELGKEQTKALKDMALNEGTTLYVVLLAIFYVLLSKISAQEDIIIGTPVAGRRHSDLENIIGSFVNTLALRNYPEGEKKFIDFLYLVKQNTLLAFENQDYPFEELVEQVSVTRDVSRNPLFDVMFALHNMESEKIEIPGLKLLPYNYDSKISKFDLSLNGTEVDEKLVFLLEYCTRLFNNETIKRIISYFKNIASSVLKKSSREISEIEIMTRDEKQKLLYELNDTTVQFPGDKTIHQLFKDQVEWTPDNIAVVAQSASLHSPACAAHSAITYSELNKRSNQLAHRLSEKGVKPGIIVGLIVKRSVEMMVSLLGILKAGGAYLPIDPDYPTERIGYILEDSNVKILVSDRSMMSKVSKPCEVIDINSAIIEGKSRGLPMSEFSSTHPPIDSTTQQKLAYVIYTSGSTGKPKGVMIEHRPVVNFIKGITNIISFGKRDNILSLTTISFDIFGLETLLPLTKGSKVIIGSQEDQLNVCAAASEIEREQTTIFQTTPSRLQLFLSNEDAVKSLGLLEYLLVGGEIFPPTLLEKVRHIINGKIYNLYGPTETTIWSTVKDLTGEQSLNIGKPIANTMIYILSKRGGLQPLGVSGELCIAGDGLSRGYINESELTHDRFIFNQVKKGQRLYRTGDVARWLPDGNIECLGRLDQQVKIRGFRIELGEIENQLRKYPGIKSAAVIVRENKDRYKYLIAYIVTDERLTVSELRDYLLKSLPDYMVPTYFVTLKNLPLTHTGKINRKALPAPNGIGMESDIEYAAPRSPVERKLVEIWENVLGRDYVGINENFFVIGGDSVKTIQVASRMKNAGYMLEMKQIFKYPRISELSRMVKKIERTADQSVITGTIPLTPIQRWFLNTQYSAHRDFNQAVILRSYYDGKFDEEALNLLFLKLQEHHDALRTIFKEENGSVIQTNQGLEYPFSLEVYDLRNLENAAELLELKVNKARISINPETGPLMKPVLFHLDDGDRLLIVIHSLVVDGVSWRILLEDFETLYQQFKEGKKLSLPLKTDAFKLWAKMLSGYDHNEFLLKEKMYWRELDSKKITHIKKDFKEGENDLKNLDTLSFTLYEANTHLLLTDVNKPFNTEISDILLTALGLSIKGIFCSDQLLIEIQDHAFSRQQIAEDEDIDIRRTVGCFTTVFPVLLDFSYESERNLGRQLKEIKENMRQRRLLDGGIRYGVLRDPTTVDEQKKMDFRFKPQVSFCYLGQFDNPVEQVFFGLPKNLKGDKHQFKEKGEYEIAVTGVIVGKQLLMSLHYSKSQYKTETMKRLWRQCRQELVHIISYCLAKEEVEFTPTDLTYKGLSIEILDELMSQYPLEDLYLLTPMQEGLLFHELHNTSGSIYFEQASYRYYEELDASIVEKSLNELFRRHDILRTSFLYKNLDYPMQVVLKARQVEFYYEDISKLIGENEKTSIIKQYKEKDRKRSFDLSKDVLMRVAVIQLDKAEYELIWSYPHILLDGWSSGVIIAEFFEIYENFLKNRSYRLPAAAPYRTYIEWLEKQDKDKSRNYWKQYLEGYDEAVSFPGIKATENKGNAYKSEEFSFTLGKEKVDGLTRLVKNAHVTLNTILQTIWGIILGKYNDKKDVVFGTVVSGRPSELKGIESMVGLFINTIPIRIRYEEETTFIHLIQQVQKAAIESEPNYYYPLAETQSISALKQNLLDHIFVFENYPIEKRVIGVELTSGEELFEFSNYDLNVLVIPGDSLTFVFGYNANKYGEGLIKRIAQQIDGITAQVIENNNIKLKEITISHDLLEVNLNVIKNDKGDFEF